MKLPLTTVPNPLLREVSQPVSEVNTEIIQFIQHLGETLTGSEIPGVGISAIQVGRPLRVFMTYFPPDPNLPLKKWHKAKSVLAHYINPVITAHSQEIYLGDDKGDHQMEGCLSVPHVWGHVWRYRWVDLTYETYNPSVNSHPSSVIPEKRQSRFFGFPARVIQHEYDHLDGILFTDHILGKSPIQGFKPLKAHSNHLFFEVEDQFTPIENPNAFAKW